MVAGAGAAAGRGADRRFARQRQAGPGRGARCPRRRPALARRRRLDHRDRPGQPGEVPDDREAPPGERDRDRSDGRHPGLTDRPASGHDEAGADGAGFVVWGSRIVELVVAALRALGGACRPFGPSRRPPAADPRLARRPWPPRACPRHRGRSRTRRHRGCRRSGVAPFAACETNQPWFWGRSPAGRRVGCPFLLVGVGGVSRRRPRPRRPRARPAPRAGPARSCRRPRMPESVHPRQQPRALRPKRDGLRAPRRPRGRARRGRPAGRGGGE